MILTTAIRSCSILFAISITGIVQAQNTLTVKQLDNPIIIDGFLSSKEWANVDSTSNFTQLEPDKGIAATRKTVVRAGQFENDIYFIFVCYLLPGDHVAARIQRRDQLDDSDDVIALLLDTYNDRRTSLLFLVNGLGTLTDFKVTDDGKSADELWDTEWEAATSITTDYWIAEVRIPLSAIQHDPASGSWGANFGRVIRDNQETAWWTPVTENFRVSQGGRLTGIQPLDTRQHILRFFPYATGRYENSDITGVQNKVKGDAGLDFQYQYGSNVISNMTLNPDFATVEGDRERINLTPWELRFPDKRLFFQDGNEMFGTRISTFYSRRIGDMRYGGKLVGKAGKYQFNALSARTEENTEAGDPKAHYNAIRAKGDILKSSILGFTYTDKITDTTKVRSFSTDYVLNLGRTWKLTGQLVGSTPGDLKSHAAGFVRFARENNIYHYHVRFTSIGRNFQDNVNETGFIRDDDRRELDSDVSYRFWINKDIKYLSVSGKNNIFWSQKGVLRSWYLTYGSRMYLSNGLSFDAYYNNEYKLLDKEYNNHFYRGLLGYNTDEAAFISAGYRIGRNFDRDFHVAEVDARVQLFSKLTLNYELNYLKYSPDPELNNTVINVLGADFFFNKDLWIRIFTQNNSANDKYYFYGLFGWRFKPPFGAVYCIVNTDQFVDLETDVTARSEVLFLKLTYPISLL